MRCTASIVALAALLAFPVRAAPLSVDCGRLLDVATGRWLTGVRVDIEQGRIVSVAPRYDAPTGERIDLSGAWCLPGLIDMHTHLTEEPRPDAGNLRSLLSDNPADLALRGVGFAEKTLHAGFTTVRDLGSRGNVDIALKRAIAKGWVHGPRMFSAGKSIATTGGHADHRNSLSHELTQALGSPGPVQGVINSADEARRAVRQRYQDGADLIKITATGGVLSLATNSQNPQFQDDELHAIIATARDYGYKVAAHAHGAEGMKRALRAGVDSIEHGTYMDDEAIQLFRKTGAWYVPTISAGRYVGEMAKLPDFYAPIVRPKAAAVGALIQQTFAKAFRAGVKIAFGTDAGVFPHGENAGEFGYMIEAGMSPLEAIRAATVNAAELLGQQGTIGQLAPGYYADLIAVDADPTQDVATLRQLRFVMKEGVVYKR